MDLAAVMEEVAVRLRAITGLKVFGYPPDAVTAPAAIVTYPGTILFDGAYQRGMDTMDPSVVALVGKVTSRTTRERIGKYCNGSGPESFKAILDAEGYTTCDVVTVKSVDFDMITMGAVEYLAATFTLEIVGQGD